MTQQQIIQLLQAINQLQAYVPPMLFAPVAQSEAVQILVSVANGTHTCLIEPKSDNVIR